MEKERDELSDRLDLECLDHDMTRGYRQHAEQHLAAARTEVERLTTERDALRAEVEQAGPGDIVAVAGLDEVGIGETLSDREDPRPLPVITVDEPSLAILVGINTSPLAGRDGTARFRLDGTPAAGILRAKTGTLENVSAFSGYVATADGEVLAFSIVVNDYPGRYSQVIDGIDSVAAAIAAGSRSNAGGSSRTRIGTPPAARIRTS